MMKSKVFKILVTCLLIILLFSIATEAFAIATSPWSSPNAFDGKELANDHILTKTVRVPLAFILSIVRNVAVIAAICSLIWAGIRYMFPSLTLFGPAIDKAEVKRDIPRFVIGSVLLFGTSALLTFIQYIIEDIFG